VVVVVVSTALAANGQQVVVVVLVVELVAPAVVVVVDVLVPAPGVHWSSTSDHSLDEFAQTHLHFPEHTAAAVVVVVLAAVPDRLELLTLTTTYCSPVPASSSTGQTISHGDAELLLLTSRRLPTTGRAQRCVTSVTLTLVRTSPLATATAEPHCGHGAVRIAMRPLTSVGTVARKLRCPDAQASTPTDGNTDGESSCTTSNRSKSPHVPLRMTTRSGSRLPFCRSNDSDRC